MRPQSDTNRFVFSEEPSRLRPGEGDGLGGERRRVNVATHQNVHLLLSLHLRLLGAKGHLVSDVGGANKEYYLHLPMHMDLC